MNTSQLEKELETLGVPKDYYSVNGHLTSDTYIRNQVYTKWEYLCFDEKGNQKIY